MKCGNKMLERIERARKSVNMIIKDKINVGKFKVVNMVLDASKAEDLREDDNNENQEIDAHTIADFVALFTLNRPESRLTSRGSAAHNTRSLEDMVLEDWREQALNWGGDDVQANVIFQQLCEAYSRKGRHYHTLTHIKTMLNVGLAFRQHISCWPAFYFAVWFHDVVQEQTKDDEVQSAAFARKCLDILKVPALIIDTCCHYILATRQHKVSADQKGDNNTALFIDTDLAILAADRVTYTAYALACRREYDVLTFFYRRGRRNFLRQLLQREFIFSSDIFRERYEHLARNNIAWELECLL